MSAARDMYRVLRSRVQQTCRAIYNRKLKKRLLNHAPSIICDNCIAGVMYHELGIPFLSPTINLFMYPDDYLKFVKNLRFYLSCELIESKERGLDEGREYPIGLLEDIHIHFMHYETFEIAARKWRERCERVNFNNLFIIMTQREGNDCTYDHLKEFDQLHYANKVVFVNREYHDIKSSFYIKGFESKSGVGNLIAYKQPTWLAVHHYDAFDYVKWLNKK